MALLQLPDRSRRSDLTLPGQTTLTYFAAAFFTLTLLTDLAYMQTTILMWKDFSSWLLFAGLVAGLLGVLLWLIRLAFYRQRPLWSVIVVNSMVLAAAFLNSLLHAGDGWTYIVPWGIAVSVATCLLMLASAALGRRALINKTHNV
jgi:uncharacterized membrane protein